MHYVLKTHDFSNRVKKLALLPRLIASAGILVISVAAVNGSASANHSWDGYHWARKSNPFTLKIGENLTSAWEPYLTTTSKDWSISTVLDTQVVNSNKIPKTCKPTLGRVEVCNAKYGSNGWLGLAQIWINGDHITQGTVKINDTYFARAPYNTSEEKNHVMCQEVGHTLGLAHQDESGATLGTCMDYSMSPTSQHPNTHDYEELEEIYSHLDTTSTLASTSAFSRANASALENQSEWGRRVYHSKKDCLDVYERQIDGHKIVSFVISDAYEISK